MIGTSLGPAPVPVLTGLMMSEGGDVNVGNGGAQFDFSGNGTLAYVPGSVVSVAFQVVSVDRNGEQLSTYGQPRFITSPRLSPDGRQLAFQTFGMAGTEVSVFDIDRGVLNQLTFTGRAGQPLWSHDGEFIIYRDDDEDGIQQVFRKPADGSGEPEQLTQSPDLQAPWSVSADGKLLARHVQLAGQGGFDIHVLNLEDGTDAPFLEGPANEFYPMFSPDGSHIAYASDQDGRMEVYIRRYPDADGLRLVSSEGGSYPTWSSNGRELYYWNAGSIVVVPMEVEGGVLSPGRAELLFEGDFAAYQFFSPYDVAPDGQSFVMLTGAGADASRDFQPTLVFNWFEELQRLVPAGR